jgi:hypothetical protein|tara:strand:+ start:1817 stop:2764 length:948 start_codon:yes stop_codon:yes gene_type:complete
MSDSKETAVGSLSGKKTFSLNSVVKISKDFVESNSIIAQFGFLLLIIILFVSILRIGSNILIWFLSPSKDPILTPGLNNAKHMIIIPQDPSLKNSIQILRSVDQEKGMEFTWSIWMYIDEFVNYKKDDYKHVFHKGNDIISQPSENGNSGEITPGGLAVPINAPGLYITPYVNNLEIVMNTHDKINDNILIKNVPINKWINVIIRLNNQHQLDVYINGILSKRHTLSGVARQNYGNVFSTMNGGFSGYTSELRYFDNAIGLGKINEIVKSGPNLKIYDNGNNTGITTGRPQYLSTKWYFNEVGEDLHTTNMNRSS